MKKSIKVLVLSMILVTLLPVSIFAKDETSEEFAGNFFEAGSSPTITDIKARDVFIAGQNVTVTDSDVKGNVFAAGSNVDVKDVYAGADIFVAGQVVSIKDDDIDGSIIAAGQSIIIEDCDASGVMACAGNLRFESSSAEEVNLSGEEVVFNGVASGDVEITADTIVIGDEARINGTLTVNAKVEPEISESATVAQYKFNEIKDEDTENTASKVTIVAKVLHKLATRAYWIPAGIIIALALSLLFGKTLDCAGEVFKTRTSNMIISGVVMWALIPVAALTLAITIIAAPLSGIVMIAYIFCIALGLSFAGASLGRVVLPKLNPILASVIGVAVLQAVRIIPVAGTVVAVASDMYLLGYIGVVIIDSIKSDKSAPVVVAQALDEPPVLTANVTEDSEA